MLKSPLTYILVPLTVLALAGCSSSDETEVSQVISPDGLVQADISRWSLPTDPYVTYPSQLELYAIELATSDCMATLGQHFEAVSYPIDPPPSEGLNPAGHRLFNQSIAGKYGYHEAPDPVQYGQRLRARDRESEQYGEQWEKDRAHCSDQVLATPPFPIRMQPIIQTIGLSGADEKHVRSAAVRWRDCMKPLGIPDLPEDPAFMPSDSLAERFGLLNEDPINAQEAVPGAVSDEEIRIASADAECRESSGYQASYYEAEWHSDFTYVEEHLPELTAALEEQKRQIEELKAYVAAHQ